jgi:hypothetical protein
MRAALSVAVLIFAGLCPSPADAQARPKRLISIGHDMPTAQQLRRDLAEMEKRALDGVVLEAKGVGVDEGINQCPLRSTFENRRWKREWFQQTIDDLKAVRPTRLKHNFLNVLANPGDVDWFDDEGWANIVDHFRIAAWVAREGNLEGVFFDAEPYTKPYAPFKYSAQPQRAQHSFAEYSAKARQRGREVMQAMVEEYPDITVGTHFMNSYVVDWEPWGGPSAVGLSDPKWALAVHSYGLQPPFIDGWLDVAPPTVTFIDGDERSYEYNTPNQFWKAAAQIKGPAQDVVSPENRAKYRAQVQVSSAIYLDAHTSPEHSYWIVRPEISRAEQIEESTAAALQAADEYVRVYGEAGRWWPDPRDTAPWATRPVHPPWPEIIPGCEQALINARDPDAARMSRLRARVGQWLSEGELHSIVRNGDFSTGPADAAGQQPLGSPDWVAGNAPAEWSSWQEEGPQGVIAWDPNAGFAKPGSGRLSNVIGGCLIQTLEVSPGERYFISAMGRFVGEGRPALSVGWKTKDGVWMGNTRETRRLAQDALFPPEPQPTDPWREMCLDVTVPEGAGQLILLPSVSGQASERDVAWFDDIHIYRLPSE